MTQTLEILPYWRKAVHCIVFNEITHMTEKQMISYAYVDKYVSVCGVHGIPLQPICTEFIVIITCIIFTILKCPLGCGLWVIIPLLNNGRHGISIMTNARYLQMLPCLMYTCWAVCEEAGRKWNWRIDTRVNGNNTTWTSQAPIQSISKY